MKQVNKIQQPKFIALIGELIDSLIC